MDDEENHLPKFRNLAQERKKDTLAGKRFLKNIQKDTNTLPTTHRFTYIYISLRINISLSMY